jgi:RNA polymerase sigma factor (sigma-70 family)
MPLPKKISRLQRSYPQLGEPDFYNSLLKVYQVYLYKFNLKGRYQPVDIMVEVILRLNNAYVSGKVIFNLKGWMRSTGYNYICELSRLEHRYISLDSPEMEPVLSLLSNIADDTKEDEYRVLHQAIHTLRPQDQEIIKMRFFEKRSWEEIAKIFASKNTQVTVVTLRQRGTRALNALREAYFHILGIE